VELRQLAYFEAVARLGGFTRAAASLHVAQSAVSAQIRALEAELGTALFTRTTRRVALTHAGDLVLARAQRVLAEISGARGDLAELAVVARGQVTLGATAVLGRYDLPNALTGFHQRFPGVALRLRTGLIAELLAALDAGEADLAVGPIHDDLPSRFAVHRLAAEHLVIALPPTHPGAAGPGAGRSALADLRDEPFICLPAGSGLRQILDDAARAAGFVPNVQFETHSAAAIRELVAAGLGVALLARSAAERAGPPIITRTPHPAVEHPPIGLLHHRDRRLSPAARACRTHLIAAAR
jgi:LysR family transcriptional regulator, transcription activator of glutamate synthase operon